MILQLLKSELGGQPPVKSFWSGHTGAGAEQMAFNPFFPPGVPAVGCGTRIAIGPYSLPFQKDAGFGAIIFFSKQRRRPRVFEIRKEISKFRLNGLESMCSQISLQKFGKFEASPPICIEYFEFNIIILKMLGILFEDLACCKILRKSAGMLTRFHNIWILW